MPRPLKPADKAKSTLDAGISAAALTFSVESGDGALYPQPYTSTTSSLGTSTTLNKTGIGATGIAQGDYIHNVTDDSWATVETVSTDSLTTSVLKGGTLNIWSSGDTYRVNEFIMTFAKTDENGNDTASEEVLISNRSTDTLTIPTGGRGFNGTVAQTFDAGDDVQLRVTSPYFEEMKKMIRGTNNATDANTTSIANLSSTANAKGASLVGIEDAGGNYTGTNVEVALTEISASLALKVGLATIGFFGDGSDGVPTWTSGASLNPSSEKSYSTATLPVSQTLTVSSSNTPLIIHNTGNVTINGTVDMNGKGGPGGAGAVSGTTNDGQAGTVGHSLDSANDLVNGAGGATTHATGGGGGPGGGGGASILGNGNPGVIGGTGGVVGSGGVAVTTLSFLASFLRGVVCGGGGSGGANGTLSSVGGNGGNGGGALVWYIGGNLTLGASSFVQCDGATGTANTGSGGNNGSGGGGGGGGGTIIIMVAGTITNNGVTITAAAGAGGLGDGSGTAGDGGAGKKGKAIIYSLSKGTIIASA